MPQITLPDGSVRQFANPVSVFDVAADIGPGLAKATLAGLVDGSLVDSSHIMEDDASLSIVTTKSEEALVQYLGVVKILGMCEPVNSSVDNLSVTVRSTSTGSWILQC